MNKLFDILIFIVLISLFACKPQVTFNEPQPPNTDNLSKFPKRILGQYISLKDNSVLKITNKTIIRTYDLDFKIHINQLDSTERLSGDTIIDIKTKEITVVKRIGDSLSYHQLFVDTLFDINESNVLKKFKGYYFINKYYNPEGWEVTKINLAKGQLTFSSISSTQDLDQLKAITESSQDTVSSYNFKATKKQFRQFINTGGFSDTETFVRQ